MNLAAALRALFTKPGPPHPLIAANNAFAAALDRDLPLERYDFVVIDTELTGLDPKKDEIVAIGAVRIREMRLHCGESFYSLVRPIKKLHSDSTLIHRLTPEQLKDARGIDEVLPRFIEFCGEAVIVGHYVGLDLGFLNKAALALLGGAVTTPSLDTLRLAMAHQESVNGPYYDHYQNQAAYNLTALAKTYRLPRFPEHNALNDAFEAAYLFLCLAQKLKKGGAVTLRDFLKAGRKWKIIY